MKLLIAVDMEGISGVVNWDQVTPNHPDYAIARKWMVADVNAAIRGAFDAGAQEIIVTDGHNLGNNLLIDELDARVRLNTGTPSTLSMVQGIQENLNGAMFIGYHARAGTSNAILDHTWSSGTIANVWLNNRLVGEVGLNAALCGFYNTAVMMVSGDEAVCSEAIETLGSIEVAVVKRASGRTSAECLSPKLAQEKICEAAARAVHRLSAGDIPEPFRMNQPVEVKLEFLNSSMADRAILLPGSRRLDGRRISFTADDMPLATTGMRAAITLARS